jgi:hypothetical protein
VYVEIIADYCENHTKHINMMRRQNAASLDAAVQGTQFYWRALKVSSTKAFCLSALYSNSRSDDEDGTEFLHHDFSVFFNWRRVHVPSMQCIQIIVGVKSQNCVREVSGSIPGAKLA